MTIDRTFSEQEHRDITFYSFYGKTPFTPATMLLFQILWVLFIPISCVLAAAARKNTPVEILILFLGAGAFWFLFWCFVFGRQERFRRRTQEQYRLIQRSSICFDDEGIRSFSQSPNGSVEVFRRWSHIKKVRITNTLYLFYSDDFIHAVSKRDLQGMENELQQYLHKYMAEKSIVIHK